MQEFALNQAIFFHAFINYLLLLIASINGIVLFSIKDFVKINKTSFILTPLFLGLLFINFLSGVSVWAMMKFAFSPKICLMILANFMFVFEIFRVKKLRLARQNPSIRHTYIKIARMVNFAYIAIILAFVVF